MFQDFDEGGHDGGEMAGARDKLLHLLRKWDVRNVLILVTREDKRLLPPTISASEGLARLKYMVDAAKSVLEACYKDSLGEQVHTIFQEKHFTTRSANQIASCKNKNPIQK